MVDAALNVGGRADRGALRLRRPARTGRQPRTDRRSPEPLPHRRRRRRGCARRLGRDRGGDRRRSGWRFARRARTARVGDGTCADAPRPGGAAQHDAIDGHLSSWCDGADRRRDRRLPVGRRRSGRQGDAAARAGGAAAAAGPRVLRGGRSADHRNRPARHAADPVLTRPRPVPPPRRRRSSASTTTRCCGPSASPTTRSASSRRTGVIGRVPDSAR